MATIPIPKDLLEEIFLRLSTPADLARASAACAPFRHAIADRAFRRRFRALHRAPLLGFALDETVGFQPAQAPHPSAPLAQALLAAADFTYSFVPSPNPAAHDHDDICWRPRAVRDGRVLLDWISSEGRAVRHWSYPSDNGDGDTMVSALIDRALHDVEGLFDGAGARLNWIKLAPTNAADFRLAVCDPLARRYVLLPPIPEDLAGQPRHSLLEFEPMLAPAGDGDGDDETSFRVICTAKYQTTLAAFVFSSTSRQWTVTESPRWKSFAKLYCLNLPCFEYVRGCFYWTQPWDWTDELLVLDTRTMVFSTINALTGYHLQLRGLVTRGTDMRRRGAISSGMEGDGLAMFSLVSQDGSFALHHTALHNETQEWRLEKIIQLPSQYHNFSVSTMGSAEGFLFLGGAREDVPSQDVDCFSLELETCQITKVCSKIDQFMIYNRACPYFGFPQFLSEPAI